MKIKELSIKECPLEIVERHLEKTLDVSDRLKGNLLVNQGFDEETAVEEAQRCLRDIRCQSCGICQLFCPSSCIATNEETGSVEIDYESCIGCGICAAVCPKGAIEMVIEEVE